MSTIRLESLESRVLLSGDLLAQQPAGQDGPVLTVAVAADDPSRVQVDDKGRKYLDIEAFLGLHVASWAERYFTADVFHLFENGHSRYPLSTNGQHYVIGTSGLREGPDGEYYTISVTGGDLDRPVLILIQNDQARVISQGDWQEVITRAETPGILGGVVKCTDGKFRTFRMNIADGQMVMGEAWDGLDFAIGYGGRAITGSYVLDGKSHVFIFDHTTGTVLHPTMPEGAGLMEVDIDGKGAILYSFEDARGEHVALWYNGRTTLLYSGTYIWALGFDGSRVWFLDHLSSDGLAGSDIEVSIDVSGYERPGWGAPPAVTTSAAIDDEGEDQSQDESAEQAAEEISAAADLAASTDPTQNAASPARTVAADERAPAGSTGADDLVDDVLGQLGPIEVGL